MSIVQTSLLARFIDAARRRIDAGAYETHGVPLEPNGSLRRAIQAHPAPVLAELKPRSPSSGTLLQGDAKSVLAAYRRGGAVAVSVLTDADHFDGSPELLRLAHATGLPTMMKDFVLDEAQIRAAAHHGASAVLLIERCFADAAQRERLVEAAHRNGLEVLLELHGDEEWARAAKSAADMLGVNARDLDSLDVDPQAARRLVGRIASEDPRPVVALSGIANRADRQRATAAGAHAVLVGSHLMQHPLPALALRALQRPLAKVCGIRTEAELEHAIGAGADLVGFVTGAPKSPRDIPLARVQALCSTARRHGVASVLVTPDADPARLVAWCRNARPDLIQLASMRATFDLVAALAGVPTKVLQVVEPSHAPPDNVAGIVIDTPSSLGGGTGTTHDWAQARRSVETAPGILRLVAGGLCADNVHAALAKSGADGVDASSRLEAEPGMKDAAAVRAYITQAQEAP